MLYLHLETNSLNTMALNGQYVFVIQQNNLIYFVSSNMLAAYNYLIDNINPQDKLHVKSYKTYTLYFEDSANLIIPSNCGQNFMFKKVQIFTKYNAVNSKTKLFKTQ